MSLMEMENGAAPSENSLVVPKIVNLELPYDPAISFLGK